MNQQFSIIKSIKKIAKDFYSMTFSWVSKEIPVPGQFITIRISEKNIPLLRRPFALSDYNPKKREASMIFQVRGVGTEMLAQKKAGEPLDILGPAGTAFKCDTSGHTIIVAGGICLGPMLFTASYLQKQKKPATFIFGCKTSEHVPATRNFFSLNPVICTDDGSLGFRGTTIDFLNEQKSEKNCELFACGPQAMLKGCHEYALKHAIQCYVSLEQIMACGVGACMGCVVKTVHAPGYARVCTEGAVFNSRDIAWI